MLYSNAAQAAPALRECFADKDHILIITHVSPDGDAIGSLLGIGLFLHQQGHTVTMVAPTELPVYARRLDQVDRVQVYAHNRYLPASADLVLLVDTGDVGRIGRIYEEQGSYLAARPLVVIDHHVTNSGEGIVNLVDPSLSSTCELIYQVLRAWDGQIAPAIATALLMGVVTDTQSFKTSNTTPSALRTAADLIELGADRERIMRDVYSNLSFETAKLLALALGELKRDGALAWTHVTLAMQHEVGADDDAYAEVTDYIANLGGFKATALLKERKDGAVKVSMRSLPGVDVAAVARLFGGGGHRQAAGATLQGPIDKAEAALLKALRAAVA